MTEIPANRITTNRIVEIEGPFLFFPLSACVFAFFPIRFPTIVFHGSRTFIRPSTGVGRGFPRCSPHTTGRCQPVRHGPQAGRARLWDVALYCFCVSLMVLMYVWSFLLVGSDYASLLMRFLVISRIAAPTTRIPPMM